ncbi:hypothetical protein AXK11_08630 [Cephaloticoccus primus]|uniref:Response regulatory domain-containing protein n=1 Tax=Cephaloticoccus primus TaxID=1548207 RepID=A0A139SIG5_9BACT|nr:response regulator [Cephaloticoccus primus]KXU34365.1 hypothetical protein AXK11_08630 [Cephaloticoccus primus]
MKPPYLLLIDDEAPIRELLSRFLTSSGYRVATAASVHDALREVRQKPPDLIVSDLQLEDGDGFEMIKEIKTLCPQTPIILLTGVLFEGDVIDKVLADLIDRYLEKTTPLAQIAATIRELLPPAAEAEA